MRRTHKLCVVIRIILFSGNAVRYCDGNGVWSRTDVLSCASPEFVELLEQVKKQ